MTLRGRTRFANTARLGGAGIPSGAKGLDQSKQKSRELRLFAPFPEKADRLIARIIRQL
tara:strand:+ start:575 stop:751 length:177 start_codon:yes stop_codon:yes gene_type:complete